MNAHKEMFRAQLPAGLNRVITGLKDFALKASHVDLSTKAFRMQRVDALTVEIKRIRKTSVQQQVVDLIPIRFKHGKNTGKPRRQPGRNWQLKQQPMVAPKEMVPKETAKAKEAKGKEMAKAKAKAAKAARKEEEESLQLSMENVCVHQP